MDTLAHSSEVSERSLGGTLVAPFSFVSNNEISWVSTPDIANRHFSGHKTQM